MNKPSICCVVPSIRETQMAEFRKAWAPLFERHGVTLITVWDGEQPRTEAWDYGTFPLAGATILDILGYGPPLKIDPAWAWKIEPKVKFSVHKDLFCRKTDAIRNVGFVYAACLEADYILTLDDDVHPPAGSDPVQEHLDVLQRRVPISWMNTAVEQVDSWHYHDAHGYGKTSHRGNFSDGPLYLRGFPYGIRDEAPVKVSHGVWVNVPDFDGKTQLELGKCVHCGEWAPGDGQKPSPACKKCNGTGYDGSKLPYSLPYFRGPVPKGTYFPFCGMNVMVHRDALPYLYFAPMGPDSGVSAKGKCRKCGCKEFNIHYKDEGRCPKCAEDGIVGVIDITHHGLNRFADIWCGILLKRACDSLGWAIYTGASTVIHTRASDPFKNVEQEKLGIEWNEYMWHTPNTMECLPNVSQAAIEYRRSWFDKATRFRDLIRKLQGAT